MTGMLLTTEVEYFPEILFQYGRNDSAYKFLLELTDPNFRGPGHARSGVRRDRGRRNRHVRDFARFIATHAGNAGQTAGPGRVDPAQPRAGPTERSCG